MKRNEWTRSNFKSLRHPNNKEFVTARVNVVNKKNVIRISIGIIICDLLDFTASDRVNVYINKQDRNQMIISKSLLPDDGYKLNHNGSNSSFMTFELRNDIRDAFRLSQTIILDFDITEERLLLIRLDKLRWNN